MFIYVYLYICIYTHVSIYIYIHMAAPHSPWNSKFNEHVHHHPEGDPVWPGVGDPLMVSVTIIAAVRSSYVLNLVAIQAWLDFKSQDDTTMNFAEWPKFTCEPIKTLLDGVGRCANVGGCIGHSSLPSSHLGASLAFALVTVGVAVVVHSSFENRLGDIVVRFERDGLERGAWCGLTAR